MQRAAMALMFLALAACKAPPSADAATTQQQDVAAVHAFIDDIGRTFNSGNLDAFMQVFTEDAMQSGQGYADVIGKPAIRRQYEEALAQNDIKVAFHTREVFVSGDLAYEAGTYDIIIKPRATPDAQAQTVTNRHVHVLRRQPDGAWKTWRMMTNDSPPAAPAK